MGDHRFNPFAKGAPPLASPDVRDAFNRVLHKGDMVTLNTFIGVPMFRVVDIAPNLDPSAPPNTMKVMLLANIPMVVMANRPTQQLVRVVSAAEVGLTVEPAAPDDGDSKPSTLVVE